MSKKKRGNHQPGQQQPHWQPISMLPILARNIDGMLAGDVEQYETLLQARGKPHVLDDFTVNRVKQVFGDQRQGFAVFEEQLQLWGSEDLIDGQRQEVQRLVGQMAKLRENNTKVLALAEELGMGTIDKIMAKSDEELGLEYLMRMVGGQK